MSTCSKECEATLPDYTYTLLHLSTSTPAYTLPHPLLHLTKEREAALPPLLLPALLDAALCEWSPEDNLLSREVDRPLLR